MTNKTDFDGTVTCRAGVHSACYHGAEVTATYADDGTYRSGDHSIVCDPCYLMLIPFTRSGAALLDELPAAIDHVRATLDHIKAGTNVGLRQAVIEIQHELNGVRVGSPKHRSGLATVELIEAELVKRAQVN